MTFHISCYHYETRYETKKRDDGSEYTEERQEKVVTHTASQEFDFSEWKDMSDKVEILFFIEKLSAVRLHCSDDVRYSPKAKRMYNEQSRDFINRNNRD